MLTIWGWTSEAGGGAARCKALQGAAHPRSRGLRSSVTTCCLRATASSPWVSCSLPAPPARWWRGAGSAWPPPAATQRPGRHAERDGLETGPQRSALTRRRRPLCPPCRSPGPQSRLETGGVFMSPAAWARAAICLLNSTAVVCIMRWPQAPVCLFRRPCRLACSVLPLAVQVHAVRRTPAALANRTRAGWQRVAMFVGTRKGGALKRQHAEAGRLRQAGGPAAAVHRCYPVRALLLRKPHSSSLDTVQQVRRYWAAEPKSVLCTHDAAMQWSTAEPCNAGMHQTATFGNCLQPGATTHGGAQRPQATQRSQNSRRLRTPRPC